MVKDKERGREGTNRRIPPAIHKVHSRCFSQVERHATGLQTDEEYGDVYIIHFERKKNSGHDAIIGPCTVLTEILNSGIPRLRAHRTFEAANLRCAISRCSD
jgi:hypothetical protein